MPLENGEVSRFGRPWEIRLRSEHEDATFFIIVKLALSRKSNIDGKESRRRLPDWVGLEIFFFKLRYNWHCTFYLRSNFPWEFRILDSRPTGLELFFSAGLFRKWVTGDCGEAPSHCFTSTLPPLRVGRGGVGGRTNPWSFLAGWASSVGEKTIAVSLGLHVVLVKSARLLLGKMRKESAENQRSIPRSEFQMNFFKGCQSRSP